MGLDVPDLDDRTFADLVEDARKRIPVYSDTWTDHNVHDPGITIVELLAWLAESYGYQLDQVTDRHRRTYLGLVGVTPRPPEPATVDLAIDATDDAELRGRIDAGTPLTVETPDGDELTFETTDAVTLTSARIAAIVADHDRGRTDHTAGNERRDTYFRAFGDDARPGNACYLGFDADPFDGVDRLELTVDFHEENLLPPAEHGDEPIAFEPSLRVAWQHCTAPDEWYREDAWEDLTVVRDETNHLYRGGRVVLAAPAIDDWYDEPVGILDHDRELYWLRCTPRGRPETPADDSAPRSRPDDSTPGRPITTGRRRASERYEIPPQLDAIRTNVLPAIQHRTVEEEQLSGADGEETTAAPNQRFHFAGAPVLTADVDVGEHPWTRVEDFDASGPDDRHFVLDESDGSIRFGDGRRGAIPPVGRRVRARSIVYGGGRAGNVPSGSTWRFGRDTVVMPGGSVSTPGDDRSTRAADLSGLNVEPIAPPTGGRDAESIDDAFVRAYEERTVPYRAVTAEDFREIAVRTPGLRVGRAQAVLEADGPGSARGVTVVVVPYSPPPSRPVPTRGFLEAVERHLCAHALLTDRVSVAPPTYVGVDVAASVRIARGSDARDCEESAEERLATFLDPLHGYEGEGWPFGRPVHRSEVYEVLEGVAGIDTVTDVSIVGGETELEDDTTALPYPRRIDVTVETERMRCRREF